jgi:hypothetical protein
VALPVVARFDGVRIEFYHAEHPPPHFHAIAGGEKVQIAIDDLRVLRGRMAPDRLRVVLEWARANEPLLRRAWDLAREHRDPRGV